MTLLLNCQSISKSFANRTIIHDLSMSIFAGDKIGLIGPNGSGKTTFLNILTGIETPDAGTFVPQKNLKIGYVPQSCDFTDQYPEQILIETIKENLPHYEKKRIAETWLSKVGFKDSNTPANLLSGGWKKRLSIAATLITSPELLLLDEPTNHLDLEGIFWLERFLEKTAPTYLLVSHDRYFLQNTVNRIIEIDQTYSKGQLSIDGSYSFFLRKKEEFLSGQLQQERSLATKARRETEWLRQGVKARTTKSQARIDQAEVILKEHSDLKNKNLKKRSAIDFIGTKRQSKKLLNGINISKTLGEKTLFQHLNFDLSPGTRMGLMGPNGSGKTTLLRLLTGDILPDQGKLKRADDLRIIHFDQHRSQLPLDLTLRTALSPTGDFVLFNGQRIHVNGWCKRFLFSPDLLGLKIGNLSGGERARISIAHLMLQPADLLLLDEPTNDLDIPTLETLEESLLDFPGAVVLITHDRCMLSRICNILLALGNLNQTDLYADYSQWKASQTTQSIKPKEKKAAPPRENKEALSYLEKRELKKIEGEIEKLEQEVKRLTHSLEQSEISENPQKLSEVCAEIGLTENKIEQLYLRWDELESK
jgi:ABC transport system ATP-binding/permease protein